VTPLPPHDWHAPIIAGIVRAYQRSRHATYIEVGVDRGHTLAHVISEARPTLSYVCDVTFASLAPEHRWLNSRGGDVIQHEMESVDFFALMRERGAQVDVVFIDGDHSYEAVKGDIYGALTVLGPDGTIIVHDSFPERQEWAESHCGDGWAAVAEFAQGALQVFTLPLFPGLSFMGHRPEVLLDRLR
jgi:hypothetical protein